MKILISAAKTGGHIFPAIAVADELKKRGHEIVFLGSGESIEVDAVSEKDFNYQTIKMDGYRGKSIISKMKLLFLIPLGIIRVINLIRIEKIDAMVGFGGFITIPPSIAFVIMRRPIFTHEQNSIQGSANKLLAQFATYNFLGLPIKNNVKNNLLSGNPIRDNFLKKSSCENNTNNEINIYVTGGSQGAEYLNSNIPKILQNINQNIKVKHQCGINKLTDVINLYEKSNISAEVQEFYQNPQSLIEWSDFVITRSGALSISEISSMGRGMVMIPLPSSIDNHQFHNAKYIENIGMGIVHSEEDGINELEKKITQVIEEKTYNSWKAVTNLEHLNAATLISSKIIESLSK